MSDYREIVGRMFEKQLSEALQVACAGNTAIVILPPVFPKQEALNWLIRHVPANLTHAVRQVSDALHFEGTRGSVRLYLANHYTFDRNQRRLLDYPASVPTFLHPDLEGL